MLNVEELTEKVLRANKMLEAQADILSRCAKDLEEIERDYEVISLLVSRLIFKYPDNETLMDIQDIIKERIA